MQEQTPVQEFVLTIHGPLVTSSQYHKQLPQVVVVEVEVLEVEVLVVEVLVVVV